MKKIKSQLNEINLNDSYLVINGEEVNNSTNVKVKLIKSLQNLYEYVLTCLSNEELDLIIKNDIDAKYNIKLNINSQSKILINQTFIIAKNTNFNCTLNINLKENSALTINCLNDVKNNLNYDFNANLNNSSALTFNYANLGKSNNNNINVYLNGENSNAKINTITFANNKDVVNFIINVNHLSVNTYAEVNNMGVVNNNATLKIDGVNLIEKGKSGSETFHKTKIINLKDTTTSVAKPELVINEYDVKAGHSAAVGTIDEEQIYYLMTRGLTKAEATNLIITSYITPYFELFNKKQISKIKSIIKRKIE
jgi:Fe-S cluster assembly protein SufD